MNTLFLNIAIHNIKRVCFSEKKNIVVKIGCTLIATTIISYIIWFVMYDCQLPLDVADLICLCWNISRFIQKAPYGQVTYYSNLIHLHKLTTRYRIINYLLFCFTYIKRNGSGWKHIRFYIESRDAKLAVLWRNVKKCIYSVYKNTKWKKMQWLLGQT